MTTLHHLSLLALLCILVLLSGCAAQIAPTSTPLPTSQPTALPSPTEAPPTHTPTTVPPTPTPTPGPSPSATPVVYVTWERVDVYDAPDGEFTGYYIPGKEFIVVREDGDWLQIDQGPDRSAWVRKSDTAYGPPGASTPTPMPSPTQKVIPTPTGIPAVGGVYNISGYGLRLTTKMGDSCDLQPTSFIPLQEGDTYLEVIAGFVSGPTQDLSGQTVTVVDEYWRPSRLGWARSFSDRIEWYFGVSGASRRFVLRFPDGSVIDLTPLMPQ